MSLTPDDRYDPPLNPVEVEQAIRQLATSIGQHVRVVSDLLATYREAERVYDSAFAEAYMAHRGPAHEKRYAAELETSELRQLRDQAEVEWRYAERRAQAEERELSAYQSINRSVAGMFSAAGHMGGGG